jgi:hypothetical protein
MSETPEFWTDPILVRMGSSRPQWLPTSSQSVNSVKATLFEIGIGFNILPIATPDRYHVAPSVAA